MLQTTFVDCLMEQTHPEFVRNEDSDTRYTDTLFIEQQRGCSIKATPITIVMQNSRQKSFLLNIIDTPGCNRLRKSGINVVFILMFVIAFVVLAKLTAISVGFS